MQNYLVVLRHDFKLFVHIPSSKHDPMIGVGKEVPPF